MHTRYRSLHLSIVGAPSRAVAYNSANQQIIRCIASTLKFLWYGSMEWNMEENFSMEWNMEENFSMEWNMEWKIFGMEWKWNGRKLPVWNMEKSSSIPYHALFTTGVTRTNYLANLIDRKRQISYFYKMSHSCLSWVTKRLMHITELINTHALTFNTG